MIQFGDTATAEAYAQEQQEFFHKRLRTGSLWGLLFYPLFSILDHAVYPEHFDLFLLLRILSEVVLIFGFLYTTFRKNLRNVQVVGVIEYLALTMSILAMIHAADGYQSPYYVGLILVLLFLLFICPLSLKSTLVVTIIVLLGYLIPIIVIGNISEPSIFAASTTFLFGIILFINVSAEVAETLRRQEFSARSSLAKANQDLKDLDRVKTRFFANVSHEVRTPLTSIIAPLQSLRQGDVGNMKPDQNELLDQMHRNAIRLLDLINQMLDFSKLEEGKVHLRLSPVDIGDYTEEIVSLFKEVTARKGLELNFISKDGCSDDVYIDRDRYERIITNLIRNAVKFTSEGGVEIEIARMNADILLKVTDTGIGIPETHLSKIFKRFEQVDGTSKRPYEGTGLGLAIVEESVRLMHGEIAVESVVDIGTVFSVRIPGNLTVREPDAFIERRSNDRRNLFEDRGGEDRRNDERRRTDYSHIPVADLAQVESEGYTSRENLPPEEGNESDTEKYRVLVCEDNDDLRNYISRILDRMGHRVSTAPDGSEAWDRLNSDESYDLLVTDLMMPRMDGYELLQAIRESEELRNLPVVMITAKAGDDPKLKALNIGADDYLQKPINVRELDARIRNLLTSRDLRQAAADAAVLDSRIEELRMSFAQALEIRDAETGNHSKDVLAIGSHIARELEVPQDQKLKDSLLLHDIGKIGIPDNILLKPSHLTEEEYKVMQTHPEVGKKLLENFSSFREVSEIIMAHQEHWDGTGYPLGLEGEGIPLIARIIAVADAYHAMTNTRPYRKAMSHTQAIEEIGTNKGTQFDPDVVEAFLRVRESQLPKP